MKLLITGRIFDTRKQKLEDIVSEVQLLLHKLTDGKRQITFSATQETPKDITLCFQRSIPSDYRYNFEKSILDSDTYIICGISNEFRLPVMWPEAPFNYTYYTGQEDFIECYKRSAPKLGCRKPKTMEFEISYTDLKLKLSY